MKIKIILGFFLLSIFFAFAQEKGKIEQNFIYNKSNKNSVESKPKSLDSMKLFEKDDYSIQYPKK